MRLMPLKYQRLFVVFSMFIAGSVFAEEPAQSPLVVTSPVRPIMMLNMSKDHQLFFKLYDDYADITDPDGGDPDGIPDTTYNNNYDYYGYFDSEKCYDYNSASKLFEPESFTGNHYCDGSQWSGNFLNWATMTRIDAVRKILYGGYRDVDTSSQTVLWRTMLPNDAHSFAKYYNGSDLASLVPSSYDSNSSDSDVRKRGITICNTTEPNSRSSYSQNLTSSNSRSLMRVVKGNYSLWASNERWQCRVKTGSNGNDSSVSGIYAYSSSPSSSDDYDVRVEVCSDSSLIDETNNEQCRGYTGNGLTYKPTGILQSYGEDDSILFGLMTGSYVNNKKGGVLRKAVSSITNEINGNGTFTTPDGGGIINTLNKLMIYGYSFSNGTGSGNGTYINGDSCKWQISSFNNGQCSNWGNPQAEIYLESLRYLSGQRWAEFSNYYGDDNARITGLTSLYEWDDPVGTSCTPINILQFNTSSTSYDTDDLSKAGSELGINIDNYLSNISSAENITNHQYFVGENGSDSNQLCTAKTVSSLANVAGFCPDAPRLEGGYDLAGLAFAARKVGIGNDREKVKTFGVSLAPAVPKVEATVPGTDNRKKIVIIPACRNSSIGGNCAIVDFKVVEQSLFERYGIRSSIGYLGG